MKFRASNLLHIVEFHRIRNVISTQFHSIECTWDHPLGVSKFIEKPTLIKWYYTYCPTTDEIYHNAMVRYIQKNNNIFISAYNKKNMAIKKYIEKL